MKYSLINFDIVALQKIYIKMYTIIIVFDKYNDFLRISYLISLKKINNVMNKWKLAFLRLIEGAIFMVLADLKTKC